MMTEQNRETYFLAVRIIVVLIIEIGTVIAQADLAGTSGEMLLLLALFLGFLVGKECLPRRLGWISFLAAGVVLGLIIGQCGFGYIMLGMILFYEGISLFSGRSFFWYLIPLLFVYAPSEIPTGIRLLVCTFLGIVYFQHDMVIESYRRQMREDSFVEQRMKQSVRQKEIAWKKELNRGILVTENQLLEERARLSQTLHDRLGHSINGSIYQLEAVKVLIEKDTKTSRDMVQAVIDNLRTGMDEIRVILRRERPEKYKMALLQLRQLCEECKGMGVEAQLLTEGEMEHIPEKYLEIVLDNAVEAVTNALKYAKCSKIEIRIHVMNQIIRCSVKDNGVGCSEVVDGMGISGMRRRVRSVNGILDFNTEIGFTVNMLLPLEP